MGIGLGKYGDEFLQPFKIKGQDTTFGLGFKARRKDFKAMIGQRREKRRDKATDNTIETPLKTPHLSVTFPTPTIPTSRSHLNRHQWGRD